MKISINWLKDYLETDHTPEEISEILTNLGLEVEKISDFESIKGGLKGVVAGKVLECGKHPNACLLYTSPSPRDATTSRMPSSA